MGSRGQYRLMLHHEIRVSPDARVIEHLEGSVVAGVCRASCCLGVPHWIGCSVGIWHLDRGCGRSRRGLDPIASTAGWAYRSANTQRYRRRRVQQPSSRVLDAHCRSRVLWCSASHTQRYCVMDGRTQLRRQFLRSSREYRRTCDPAVQPVPYQKVSDGRPRRLGHKWSSWVGITLDPGSRTPRGGKSREPIQMLVTLGLSSAGRTRKFPDFVVECLDKRSGGYEAAHVASYEAAD